MKESVEKRIKSNIESLKEDWAQNWIAHKWNSMLTTPEAKKQVEAALVNMKEIQGKIDWMNVQLKDLDEAFKE